MIVPLIRELFLFLSRNSEVRSRLDMYLNRHSYGVHHRGPGGAGWKTSGGTFKKDVDERERIDR